MSVHVVIDQWIDVDGITRSAQAGSGPRHAMLELAACVDGRLHVPGGPGTSDANAPRRSDRVLGRAAAGADLWAHARAVTERLTSSDTVYCNSEDLGGALAVSCARAGKRPRLAVMAHNIGRPRVRALLTLGRARDRVDVVVTLSTRQEVLTRQRFGIAADRVVRIADHTDTGFFTPAHDGCDPPPGRSRFADAGTYVASVGLEQRDFATLIEAADGLGIHLRISGSSSSSSARAAGLPSPLPEWIHRQRYEWCELRDLYRGAAAVVIPLRDNDYAAGVQSLLEAWACRRTVVVTNTRGLADYVDASRSIPVPSRDPGAMREALERALGDTGLARSLAYAGHERVQQEHTMETHVRAIAAILRGL